MDLGHRGPGWQRNYYEHIIRELGRATPYGVYDTRERLD